MVDSKRRRAVHGESEPREDEKETAE